MYHFRINNLNIYFQCSTSKLFNYDLIFLISSIYYLNKVNKSFSIEEIPSGILIELKFEQLPNAS